MTVHFIDIFGKTCEFVSVVGFRLEKINLNGFSCSIFTENQNYSEPYPHRFVFEKTQGYIPAHGAANGSYFESIFSIDLHGFAKIEVTDNIAILNVSSQPYQYNELNSVLIQMDSLEFEDSRTTGKTISINSGDSIKIAEKDFGYSWLTE